MNNRYMSAGIVFHSLAALAYGLLAVSLWQPLKGGDPKTNVGGVRRSCLLGAIVLHGAGLYMAILHSANHLYLGWALALSAALWLGMIVFWLESLVMRIDGLLLILLPAAAVISAVAAVFHHGHLVSNAGDEWLRIHLLIALTAYGLTTVAALQAMLMAALDRYLHRPVEHAGERGSLSRALDAIPPLLVQERLLFRLIWISFSVLTLTVISGAIVSQRLTGALFPLDHKTIFTLLSWLTFAVLLLGRHLRGWRGRQALHWTLAGFAFVLLSYSGSRFVIDVILHRG